MSETVRYSSFGWQISATSTVPPPAGDALQTIAGDDLTTLTLDPIETL